MINLVYLEQGHQYSIERQNRIQDNLIIWRLKNERKYWHREEGPSIICFTTQTEIHYQNDGWVKEIPIEYNSLTKHIIKVHTDFINSQNDPVWDHNLLHFGIELSKQLSYVTEIQNNLPGVWQSLQDIIMFPGYYDFMLKKAILKVDKNKGFL